MCDCSAASQKFIQDSLEANWRERAYYGLPVKSEEERLWRSEHGYNMAASGSTAASITTGHGAVQGDDGEQPAIAVGGGSG